MRQSNDKRGERNCECDEMEDGDHSNGTSPAAKDDVSDDNEEDRHDSLEG